MSEPLGPRFRLVHELHEPSPTSALFLARVVDANRRELRTERWATLERSLEQLGATREDAYDPKPDWTFEEIPLLSERVLTRATSSSN
jgi:hypothetical protein